MTTCYVLLTYSSWAQ